MRNPPNSKIYAHLPVRRPSFLSQPSPCLQRIDHPKLLLHRPQRSIQHVRRPHIRRPLRFAKRPHQRPPRRATCLDAHLQRPLRRLIDRSRARSRARRGSHRKRRTRIQLFKICAVQLRQPSHDPGTCFHQKQNQPFRMRAMRRSARQIRPQRFFPRTELDVRSQQLPDHAIAAADRKTRSHAAKPVPRTFKPPPTRPPAPAPPEPGSSPSAIPHRPDSKYSPRRHVEIHAT